MYPAHTFIPSTITRLCSSPISHVHTYYRALAQEADQLYLLGRYHSINIIQEVNATGHKSSKALPPSTPSNVCWYDLRFCKRAKKYLPHCKHYKNYNTNQNQGNWQRDQPFTTPPLSNN